MNLSMKNRIFLSALMGVLLMFIISYIVVFYNINSAYKTIYFQTRENLLQKSKDYIKDITEISIQNIDKIREFSNVNNFSKAKELAAFALRSAKYENGTNYVFAFDANGLMQVHPSLEGKNVFNLKDVDGIPIIQNLIKTALENKEGGFVEYKWNKVKGEEPLPKLSFAKYYKEYNWIVGTGIYIDDIDNNLKVLEKEFNQKKRNMIFMFILISVSVAVVIFFILNIQIKKSMLPLKKIVSVIQCTADRLQETFNLTVVSLKNQKEKITETSTAITELTASIQEISSNAVESDKLSSNTKKSAITGEEAVNKTIERLTDITQNVKTAGDMTKKLGERSKEIDNIVRTITEISEQTNLLALNAAIEAARAGEQGRGFAVVADEVRKLAERSAKSAQEIRDIIEKIQIEMHDTIKIIESSTRSTIDGMYVTESLKESITTIMSNATDTTDSISEISTALKQQAEVCDSISTATDIITENIKSIDEKNNALYTFINDLKMTAANLEEQMNETANK